MTLVHGQRPFVASPVRELGDADSQFRRVQDQLPLTPHQYASRLVSVAVTATAADDVLLANATGGAVTVTMPDAALNVGRRFTVVRTNAGGNAVTVAAVLGGNISLGSQYAGATVQSCITAAPATFGWVRVPS